MEVKTWEDTVMNPEEMVPMKHKWEIRDAQAEISFKAGYGEGYKKGKADTKSSRYAGMSNNEIFGHPG